MPLIEFLNGKINSLKRFFLTDNFHNLGCTAGSGSHTRYRDTNAPHKCSCFDLKLLRNRHKRRSTRKRDSRTSPRAARRAVMPRRTQVEFPVNTSRLHALSAAASQRLFSSLLTTDPYIAALVSKKSRTLSRVKPYQNKIDIF